MTDFWPEKDGLVADGFTVGFCYADHTTITANYPVTYGTHAASRLAVDVCAAIGDGIGVALKTPVAVGDMIPVCFYGIVKMVVGTTGVGAYIPAIGKYVHSDANLGVINAQGGSTNTSTYKLFGGASYVLGIALQTPVAAADEFLVLVGKCI